MTERIRPIVVVNFDSYNPPAKAVNKEIREGGALTWVRWQTNAHRDKDILDMPVTQRWVWLVLCELAGQQKRAPDGLRYIKMTPKQIARAAEMSVEDVTPALQHLRKCGRIKVISGGARVAKRHQSGGDGVVDRHRLGGHVPTYLQTDVPGGGGGVVTHDKEDGSLKRSGREDGRAHFDLVAVARDIQARALGTAR